MPKAPQLTVEQVRERLAYDPATGAFTWLVSLKGNKGVGSVAGGLSAHLGYWLIGLLRQRHYAHRLAWLLTHGEWPEHQIDHINGDRADNRIANLRCLTHADNQLNRHRFRPNKHGLPGVDIDPKNGTYRTRVIVRGQRTQLHGFQTPEEAHAAFMALRAEVETSL